MPISDALKLIFDLFYRFYRIVTNRPKIICDEVYTSPARWKPDYIPECLRNGSANEETSGVEILCNVSFSLSNEGAVDTSIKDIYIDVKYVDPKRSQERHSRLDCAFQKGVVVGPRRTWSGGAVVCGTLWGVDELPKNMETTLVIEPVSQKPVCKKIRLWFE